MEYKYHEINMQTGKQTHGALERHKGYAYKILPHKGDEAIFKFYGWAAWHLDPNGQSIRIFKDTTISLEAKAEYAESIGTLGSRTWPWQQKMVFNAYVGYPVVRVETRE